MANSSPVSSAPLFGASTPAQIRRIQDRLRRRAKAHSADPEVARAILVEIGALSEANVDG